MKAKANNVEIHIVLEFIDWCLYSRGEGKGAGGWASKGTSKTSDELISMETGNHVGN